MANRREWRSPVIFWIGELLPGGNGAVLIKHSL